MPTSQQLLLLRNGQALEGQISRSGDVYRVNLPNGEIRIRAADVELVCKDFEEGYERKRAAIPIGSLRDHLDLAQWCERNKLFDHAAAELADAAAIAPANPMVGFFQRRLQTTMNPPLERPKTETTKDQSPANEELDRLIRGLPHKTIESFTQSVQPLLMNSCTTSGCHGPQSENGLRLERIGSDQTVGRRLTQRNIYAVMQYVDRNNPLASRILTIPIAPHGTAKTAVFTDQQAMQYKRLLDWVMQLGPNTLPASTPSFLNNQPMLADTVLEAESPTKAPHVLSQDARKARPMPSVIHPGATAGLSLGATTNLRSVPGLSSSARLDKRPGGTGVSPVQISSSATQAAYQVPVSKPAATDNSADSESQRPKIKRGATLPEFTPKDPFDPEIFNRRYLKPTTSDSPSSPPTTSGGN